MVKEIWFAPEEFRGHKIHCEKAYSIDGSEYRIFCYISSPNVSFQGREAGETYAVTFGATKEEAVEMAKQKIAETIANLDSRPKRRSIEQKLRDAMG